MSINSGADDSIPSPHLAQIQTTSDWKIVHHRLFQLDPDEANQVHVGIEGFTVWDLFFLQDLVLIENVARHLLLDVGWYPHADPEGAFRLLVVREAEGSSDTDVSYDWMDPIVDIETRSIDELLARLHEAIHCYK